MLGSLLTLMSEVASVVVLGVELGMSWWCGPDGARWGVLRVVMGRLRGERDAW